MTEDDAVTMLLGPERKWTGPHTLDMLNDDRVCITLAGPSSETTFDIVTEARDRLPPRSYFLVDCMRAWLSAGRTTTCLYFSVRESPFITPEDMGRFIRSSRSNPSEGGVVRCPFVNLAY